MSEDQSEKVMKCSHCSQLLPESKLDLHEAYCRRNRIKCDKCSEFIDKNEVEAHENEVHKKVICQYCKWQMEVSKQQSHKDICPERPTFCQYCEVEVPFSTFEVHYKQCGSRTQFCLKCQENIQIRDFTNHVISCNGVPKAEEKKHSVRPEIKKEGSSYPDPQKHDLKSAQIVSQNQKMIEEQIKLKNKYMPQMQKEINDHKQDKQREESKVVQTTQSKHSYQPAKQVSPPEKKNNYSASHSNQQKVAQPSYKPTVQNIGQSKQSVQKQTGVMIMDANLSKNKVPQNGLRPDPKKHSTQPAHKDNYDRVPQYQAPSQSSYQHKEASRAEKQREDPIDDIISRLQREDLEKRNQPEEKEALDPESFRNQMFDLQNMTESFRFDSDPKIQLALLESLNQQNQMYANAATKQKKEYGSSSQNPSQKGYVYKQQVQAPKQSTESNNLRHDRIEKKENIPQSGNQQKDKLPSYQGKDRMPASQDRQPANKQAYQPAQHAMEVEDDPELQQILYDSMTQQQRKNRPKNY